MTLMDELEYRRWIQTMPSCAYVPLTDSEHRLQHQHGEFYFHPPEWWETMVEAYQITYAKRFKTDSKTFSGA